MKLLLTDCSTLRYKNDISFNVFKSFGDTVCYDNISHYELLNEIKDTDILLCNKTVIDENIINSAPKLKYIGLFATGYNNIDIPTANRRGIIVCNAADYSTSAVAQQVFAYILTHFSAVEDYSRLVKQGAWISSLTFSMLCCPTDELAGKSIGIIGYGSIGKKVTQIATAFDMKPIIFTRTPKKDSSVSFVSFDELLKNSDIITVHCPLNAESKEMFNSEAFGKMKKNAFFINTSRGGVVNEAALRTALISGQIAGAAVDVLQYEPMKSDCPLKDIPNIIITPHTAWAPLATRKRLIGIVADNIAAFLNGTPKNSVNQ